MQLSEMQLAEKQRLHDASVHHILNTTIFDQCLTGGDFSTPFPLRLQLLHAAAQGDLDAVGTLLQGGAHVDSRDGEAWTPLIAACRQGRSQVVQLLLQSNAAVNLADRQGFTALHHAVTPGGHADAVQMLLQAGANVNRGSLPEGRTPFMLACCHGHADMLQPLVQAGAEPRLKATQREGGDALECASQYGHAAVVRVLLQELGVPGNERDCLREPVTYGRLEVVKLLVAHGAERKFTLGLVPQATAEERAQALGHIAMHGWLVRTRDWTPLHYVEYMSPARTRALLREDAPIHACGNEGGQSPLDLANLLIAQGGGSANAVASAQLVAEAAQPWSIATHALWPAAGRLRAVALLLLGKLIARDDARVSAEAEAFNDVWGEYVMKHAMRRP